jgi:hypothetical protein
MTNYPLRTYPAIWAATALLILASARGTLAAAPPEPAAPPLTPKMMLQDIELVRRKYLPAEMAYTPATRAQADALLSALARRAKTLTAAEFAVGLGQVGALTDNAHSGLRLSDPRVKPAARLPLHFTWFPDALIVARGTGAAADLAGARVLRIEGRAPESLFAGLKVLEGGTDAYRKQWITEWMESQGVLHALGLAASPDSLSMTLRLAGGQLIDRKVAMVATAALPPTARKDRLWSPEPIAGEHDWTTAIAGDHLPLYLRDANTPFRLLDLPEFSALYVQFRSNEDEEGFPIAAFLKSVLDKVAAARPANLVVDLRFDIGGNLLTSLGFMRQVAQSVHGKTFILVGPYTFSAGIISAAAIKKSGGENVIVVGEQVGDRPHFWSEGDLIDLPNSHYSMRFTDGQFNLQDGCTAEPGCMDDRYPIDVNLASLEPTLAAPLTSAAYFAKRDPALEAIAEFLRCAAPTSNPPGVAPGKTKS